MYCAQHATGRHHLHPLSASPPPLRARRLVFGVNRLEKIPFPCASSPVDHDTPLLTSPPPLSLSLFPPSLSQIIGAACRQQWRLCRPTCGRGGGIRAQGRCCARGVRRGHDERRVGMNACRRLDDSTKTRRAPSCGRSDVAWRDQQQTPTCGGHDLAVVHAHPHLARTRTHGRATFLRNHTQIATPLTSCLQPKVSHAHTHARLPPCGLDPRGARACARAACNILPYSTRPAGRATPLFI
jgi:hypothetical protein